MGGLFTTVRDVSRWVAGFADAFPPRDGPEDSHPLSRGTRREMQQVHRSFSPEVAWRVRGCRAVSGVRRLRVRTIRCPDHFAVGSDRRRTAADIPDTVRRWVGTRVPGSA